jgi:hypothetical protein
MATIVARLVGILALVLSTVEPRAEEAVDLELVLAVDVSMSMDLDEQRLQRDGYVAALRDPAVVEAIRSGPHGRIAVAYLEWAGRDMQLLVLPWTIVDDAASAEQVAAILERRPVSRARRTSISGALQRSIDLLLNNGIAGLRQVIDVSGDGPNNHGAPIVEARDEAVKRGVVVNGLAIDLGRAGGGFGYFDIDNLAQYYADCVIGGPGAFALAIRQSSDFAPAIRSKLLLEIAGDTPPAAPRLIRTQLVPPATDCLVGEKRWRRYMEDGRE